MLKRRVKLTSGCTKRVWKTEKCQGKNQGKVREIAALDMGILHYFINVSGFDFCISLWALSWSVSVKGTNHLEIL